MTVATDRKNKNMRNIMGLFGLRLVVASFGILCGLTGIIAGIFEVLQGNNPTGGFVISTIGPEYTMYNDFTYYAVTIVPNFILSGVLAITISSLVMFWSIRYIHRRHGALILLMLSVAQMLVGGGWVIDLGFMASILATMIGKPLDWWSRNLPDRIITMLVRLFPLSIIVYGLISLGMLVISIIGVNSEALLNLLEPLAAAVFFPMIIMILGGIAIDVKK